MAPIKRCWMMVTFKKGRTPLDYIVERTRGGEQGPHPDGSGGNGRQIKTKQWQNAHGNP